jgi:hypothetical protein
MKIISLICVLGLILGSFSFALAQEANRVAIIIELKGKVEVKTPKSAWMPAKQGMALNPKDIIRTGKKSLAVLNLNGLGQTATVELKEKSQLQLTELLENKQEMTQKTFLDLALGEILIKAKKLHSEKSRFEVKTPTSIVGVRGTTFSVAVEAVE